MSERKPNWHEDVFYGIHYDLHARETDTNLGAELTPEHLEERLRLVGPDWIQCDCKGHAGWTSWPTEVGSTSPGVVRDALRIHRDVTRKLGIRLGMHYSGVWDTRAIELHPEWGRVNADGSRDPNNTCPLSGYRRELMIPQMLELIDEYDVDGFWVDGENWASAPCYCDDCIQEFAKRTGITEIPREAGQANWDAWLSFHRDLFVEHVTEYADACHERKPDCCICSNWMYTIRQPDPATAPVDYLSGDYTWIWGADRAALEGRILDARGITWDLMAWDFCKAGEMRSEQPWTVKTAEHLKQEVAEVVALGGAVMLYEKPERSCWLVGWRHDILAEVAQFCRERQAAAFKTQTLPQAAILHLAGTYYRHNAPLFNYAAAVDPIEGSLQALLETGRSTDILTEEIALERGCDYRLLVAPEQDGLSAQMVAFLEAFAESGGHVVLSGGHLSRETPELVGCTPREVDESGDLDPDTGSCYLEVNGRTVGVYGDWQAVEPGADTVAVAYKLVNEEPSKDTTDAVIVTRRSVGKGTITAIHGPIFRNYFAGHYPWLRDFIANIVTDLGIDWAAEIDAPAQVELVLRRRPGQIVANLLNRGAGEMLMPRRVIVDYLPPVPDVGLRVRMAQEPKSVTVVPDGDGFEWSWEDGVLTVTLDHVHIHSVVVIEE